MSVSYGGSSITFEDGSIVASGSQGFKNKFINGHMMIDQRNAGASANNVVGNLYVIDRWATNGQVANLYKTQQINGANTAASNYESGGAPAGFTHSMKVTSLSSYTTIAGTLNAPWQAIEGFNVADLDWGTSNAKSVTISFWTKCSIAGTYSVATLNSDASRSYTTTYTINTPNTWEYKTVTIPGDQSGTWNKGNTIGIYVFWALSAGSTFIASTNNSWATAGSYSASGCTQLTATNGATWYMTGAQLEKGTTASSFEFRSYGKELMLCQRYFSSIAWGNGDYYNGYNPYGASYASYTTIPLPAMRVAPTITFSGSGIQYYSDGGAWTSVGSFAYAVGLMNNGFGPAYIGFGTDSQTSKLVRNNSGSTVYFYSNSEL
jgi:hypothetical protein